MYFTCSLEIVCVVNHYMLLNPFFRERRVNILPKPYYCHVLICISVYDMTKISPFGDMVREYVGKFITEIDLMLYIWAKPLQISWVWGSRRCHLRMPNLQMSLNALTSVRENQHIVSAKAIRQHVVLRNFGARKHDYTHAPFLIKTT